MLYESGSIIEKAKEECDKLEKELKNENKKIDRIRAINLTATCIAFVLHMIGLAIMQPPVIIVALTILLTNAVTAPKFFKLMGTIEKKEKELELAKMALEIGCEQEIFPEFSNLQGLVAVEIREIPLPNKINKPNNNNNNKKR